MSHTPKNNPKWLGLTIKQITHLKKVRDELRPISNTNRKILSDLNLFNEDGSFKDNLNNLLDNFENRLSNREIAYLHKLISNKSNIPDNLMERLIKCKDSNPELKIIVNGLIK